MHSTTKYLNGHSDVVGGAVIGRDAELRERLAFLQNAMGGSQPAFDSFLVLRGTKTLAVRMERHAGERAARSRAGSRRAARSSAVIYPGLPLASAARAGAAADVGLRRHDQLRASRRDGAALARARARSCARCGVFTCAESLGGVESLAEHPAIMTHASIPPERRAALGIADGLIRLSVGIEHVDDLIADLEQALRA